MSPRRSYPYSELKSKILFGDHEPIFSKLPSNVSANLRYRGSENALLWNMIYPMAQPTLPMKSLLAVSPQWGTVKLDLEDDRLEPYFWGYSISGERLPGLDRILERIDGTGPKTEVDLFLFGKANLIVVEAKHLSQLGRCSRYSKKRCPEIHGETIPERLPCRYWESGEHEFRRLLDFGDRPRQGNPSPPCNQHYQLARTTLVGDTLAKEYQLDFSLWLLIAKTKWRSIERTWLDFTGRIRQDDLWRRMRVIAWEDIGRMFAENHE
ncbi:MAG: hypothetical protein A2Z14_12230 [Chloroflexi bacterium RBG_16_48_8]|nr:MAG: hypothetical protein A2Z14_12230 [Chloroflexi bacterium RBG_16_48_8]